MIVNDRLGDFEAFRDEVLKAFGSGHALVEWYYREGPRAADWLSGHDYMIFPVRITLSILAVPLRVAMFGSAIILIIIFIFSLTTLILARRKGMKWPVAVFLAFGVAFGLILVYSYLVEVPMARAAYTEYDTYYYTTDHIGRPFNLRDGSTLTWYEQHYPFGEPIIEWSSTMDAGSSSYLISWKPSFRFPGQYEDIDQYPFVQNHYREYMPRFGRYGRVDIIHFSSTYTTLTKYNDFSICSEQYFKSLFIADLLFLFTDYPYNYSYSNPAVNSDFYATISLPGTAVPDPPEGPGSLDQPGEPPNLKPKCIGQGWCTKQGRCICIVYGCAWWPGHGLVCVAGGPGSTRPGHPDCDPPFDCDGKRKRCNF